MQIYVSSLHTNSNAHKVPLRKVSLLSSPPNYSKNISFQSAAVIMHVHSRVIFCRVYWHFNWKIWFLLHICHCFFFSLYKWSVSSPSYHYTVSDRTSNWTSPFPFNISVPARFCPARFCCYADGFQQRAVNTTEPLLSLCCMYSILFWEPRVLVSMHHEQGMVS